VTGGLNQPCIAPCAQFLPLLLHGSCVCWCREQGRGLLVVHVVVHLLARERAVLCRSGMPRQDRNIKQLQAQMLEQERPSGLALEDPVLTELLLPKDYRGSSEVSLAADAEHSMELSSNWRFQAAGGFNTELPVLHGHLFLQAAWCSPTGSGKEQPVGVGGCRAMPCPHSTSTHQRGHGAHRNPTLPSATPIPDLSTTFRSSSHPVPSPHPRLIPQ